MTTEPTMQKFTLAGLVAEYDGGIRIPMIQRDYAQGRPSWENSRNRFLSDIWESLMPQGEPLPLDFVYGIKQDEDGTEAFCPLDGQQRLTTLFLLHWYLAARDGCFLEFQNAFRIAATQSKFTYQVRPGGRSFFHALVEHAPSATEWKTAKPEDWFRQQPWFRSIWERDPTVSGALVMLDAIHEHFKDHPEATFSNLMVGDRITFQRLDLDAVGLHDDLYLRMNARGRPLSTFETFKARFDKFQETNFPDAGQLGQCSVKSAKDFANRIDTGWLDFIWNHYGPLESDSEDTRSVDSAFINLFRAVALASLPTEQNQEGENQVAIVSFLWEGKEITPAVRTFPDFDDFQNFGCLNPLFSTQLIHLLEALSSDRSEQILGLIGSPWFGEGSLLDIVLRHNNAKPSLADFLQFAASIRYLTRFQYSVDEDNREKYRSWMRLARNLVVNSDVRAENFRQMLQGMDQLLEGSEDAVPFLATSGDYFPGFNREQTDEERLKAGLVLADNEWLSRFEQAENHGYFCGQVGFLLKYSGADEKAEDHREAQERFSNYWKKADEMFLTNGLKPKADFLWERALLAVGDFLGPGGHCIWSFLDNERGSPPAWDPKSWKRLLRDGNERRTALQRLWDRMETETLDGIAANPPDEAWRKVICELPDAFAYCQRRLIRWVDREGQPARVFLLSGKKRSAAYAELFTFCLMKGEALEQNHSRFAPLEFVRLVDDTGSDDDPHLKFEVSLNDNKLSFLLYCQNANDDGFSLWTVANEFPSELLPSLEGIVFVSETYGTTEFKVFRQTPGNPLDGTSFLDSVATALRRALPPS